MKSLRFSLRTKLLLSVSLLIVIDSVTLGQFFARHEAADIRRSVVNRGVSLAQGFRKRGWRIGFVADVTSLCFDIGDLVNFRGLI